MTSLRAHGVVADLLSDGAPDLELGHTGGSISLDAGRIPHVEATLTCSVEDAAVLAELDPRQSRRVRVRGTGLDLVTSAFATRIFDLGLRDVSPARIDGTVTIGLASDEAILSDFGQTSDDNTPRAYETSLRAVCNYVLGKIGASLEPGDLDADVTAYWGLTNLVINPSIANSTSGYSDGTGASAIDFSTAIGGYVGGSCVRWTASGTGVSRVVTARMRVEPGVAYSASAYVRAASSAAGDRVRLGVRFYDGNGSQIKTAQNAGLIVNTTTWQRTTLTGNTAPEGAATAAVFVQNDSGSTGRNTYADAFMFIEADEQVEYFDGSTASAGYVTAWDDATHNSTSTRIPLLERDPESLVWRAGVSGMDFLHPHLSAAGLRLVCDEERTWTLRDENYRTPGQVTFREGVNIIEADEVLSRDDETWFDAAVYVYTWTPPGKRERTRTDAFAMSSTPTKTIRVELDTPFPGSGRAEAIVRRAQGRGRTVTATGTPTWTEHTDQRLSIDLEGVPAQSGIVNSIQYDLDANTVSITSRTTDPLDNAISLFPDGVDIADLTGKISTLDVEDY